MTTLNNNNDERIQRLKKRYTDKKLSRSERREALGELARELYKRDPRKPISVRKQTMIECLLTFICGLNFLFMGTVEFLGIKTQYHNIISPIESVMILLIAASSVFYIFVVSKYKKEPDDELSAKHKLYAKAFGSAFIFCAVFILIIAYFAVLGHETMVINQSAAIFCFVGLMFISNTAEGVAFLITEGRSGASEDDEYEEEE